MPPCWDRNWRSRTVRTPFRLSLLRLDFSLLFPVSSAEMAALPQQPITLSFEDARHVVEEHAAEVPPGGIEIEQLLATAGRVLAESIVADRDFPPFRRAMRDGYAVRASDLTQLPVTLDVIAEIKAGVAPQDLPAEVHSGQAAAIMTGAPTPSGADAVVMVEYTSQRGSRVTVTRGVG